MPPPVTADGRIAVIRPLRANYCIKQRGNCVVIGACVRFPLKYHILLEHKRIGSARIIDLEDCRAVALDIAVKLTAIKRKTRDFLKGTSRICRLRAGRAILRLVARRGLAIAVCAARQVLQPILHGEFDGIRLPVRLHRNGFNRDRLGQVVGVAHLGSANIPAVKRVAFALRHTAGARQLAVVPNRFHPRADILAIQARNRVDRRAAVGIKQHGGCDAIVIEIDHRGFIRGDGLIIISGNWRNQRKPCVGPELRRDDIARHAGGDGRVLRQIIAAGQVLLIVVHRVLGGGRRVIDKIGLVGGDPADGNIQLAVRIDAGGIAQRDPSRIQRVAIELRQRDGRRGVVVTLVHRLNVRGRHLHVGHAVDVVYGHNILVELCVQRLHRHIGGHGLEHIVRGRLVPARGLEARARVRRKRPKGRVKIRTLGHLDAAVCNLRAVPIHKGNRHFCGLVAALRRVLIARRRIAGEERTRLVLHARRVVRQRDNIGQPAGAKHH